jgi:hypothetical protein
MGLVVHRVASARIYSSSVRSGNGATKMPVFSLEVLVSDPRRSPRRGESGSSQSLTPDGPISNLAVLKNGYVECFNARPA